MVVGDRLRGFFSNVKDRFTSVGEKLRGRVENAKQVIGETIRKAPAAIEDAIAFVSRQAINVSKTAGQVGYNVVRGTGKGVSETVGDTFNSSFWTGPVILGGLALGALVATKII